tara:strand:+ start:60 stop:179 length:120 start_codon:yes stop_codon:yes gene_type:complete
VAKAMKDKGHYKDKLIDVAYKVYRLAATEESFSGIYNDH